MSDLKANCNSIGDIICVAGIPFSHTFGASGGTPPYYFNISAWPFGSLLNGMPNVMDFATGVLTGVGSFVNPPWNPGDTGHIYTFLLTVKDADENIASTGCSLAVYLFNVPIEITAFLPGGTTGVVYNGSFNASGGTNPYTFAMVGGDFPPGLTLNADGTVTGTPSLDGIYAFQVQCTGTGGGDNNQTTQDFSINIGVTIPQVGWQLYFFSYGVLGPLAIQCGDPPTAVQGVDYFHIVPILPGGVAPYTFSIIAGALPTGMSLGAGTGLIAGAPSALGSFSFTVQVTDSGDTSVSVECSITVNPPLALSCDNPPAAVVGTPYDHTLLATGGVAPYTFEIIAGALPDGLSLDETTGEITGTPTTGGLFNFTVRVTDSYTGNGANPNTATVACSINVTNPSGLMITCDNPPVGQVGVIYSHAFPVSMGVPPYTWAIISGSLPPGLSLDPDTGIVSGTPTRGGFYEFTVQVTDADASTSQVQCSIRIKACLLVEVS